MVCSHCPTLRPTKMVCIESSKGVPTAQRQTPTQIPFGFFTHCIGLGLGRCECTIRKVRQKIDTISIFARSSRLVTKKL